MAVDLGKQVGPLPLGAWVVVVGAGLGIAYWNYTRNAAPVEEVVDTSGDPGVGTGAVGGWLPTQPGTGTTGAPAPTTNDEWARNAINVLIGLGYPPTSVDSAIRKYIAGNGLSISETAIIGVALANPNIGAPPQPLPPAEETPTTTPTTATEVGGAQIKALPVLPGWHVNQWIRDVQKRYNPSFNWDMLKQLNPNYSKLIAFRAGNSQYPGSENNIFKIPAVVRIAP